jgi:hypothetical protein
LLDKIPANVVIGRVAYLFYRIDGHRYLETIPQNKDHLDCSFRIHHLENLHLRFIVSRDVLSHVFVCWAWIYLVGGIIFIPKIENGDI